MLIWGSIADVVRVVKVEMCIMYSKGLQKTIHIVCELGPISTNGGFQARVDKHDIKLANYQTLARLFSWKQQVIKR